MDTGHPFESIYPHISLWLYTETSVYAIYPGYIEETDSEILSKLRFSLVFTADLRSRSVSIMSTILVYVSGKKSSSVNERRKTFETFLVRIKFPALSRGTNENYLNFQEVPSISCFFIWDKDGTHEIQVWT